MYDATRGRPNHDHRQRVRVTIERVVPEQTDRPTGIETYTFITTFDSPNADYLQVTTVADRNENKNGRDKSFCSSAASI